MRVDPRRLHRHLEDVQIPPAIAGLDVQLDAHFLPHIRTDAVGGGGGRCQGVGCGKFFYCVRKQTGKG